MWGFVVMTYMVSSFSFVISSHLNLKSFVSAFSFSYNIIFYLSVSLSLSLQKGKRTFRGSSTPCVKISTPERYHVQITPSSLL